MTDLLELKAKRGRCGLREELAMQAASWADHHDRAKCTEHRCVYCAQTLCGETIRVILDAHSTRTLGDLTADDLGQTVRFRVGGATYEGRLVKVQHHDHYHIGDERVTFLVLEGPENWSYMDTHRSTTPCEVGK